MSYILDALQRAESERERGNVPGLHAQPALPTAAARPSTRQLAVLATIGVALLAAAAAGLWAWRSPVAVPIDDAAQQATAPPSTLPAPVVPLAATAVAAAPVARVVAPKPATAASVIAVATRPESVTPSATAHASGASGSVTPAAPLLAELPQDVRQQIPALAVNGAVYSENPAQRLLLVNGQVLSQGSLAAPDLTLERIGANTSDFSFRGTRFRIAH